VDAIANTLPTDEQMAQLKKELNFLPWTDDVPALPPELAALQPTNVEAPGPVNVQCVAHTTVLAGFFHRRGCRVTTRVGAAYVVEPSPNDNRDEDSLHQILKHWWLSLDEYGLVDLSLSFPHESPLIYRNRCLNPGWQVAYSENPDRLKSLIQEHRRGCFYLTVNKLRVTKTACEQSMSQLFSPAKSKGLHITYGKLVQHCENLLSGNAESLTNLSQIVAWQKLAA